MKTLTIRLRRYARGASIFILLILIGCQKYSSTSCSLNSSYAAGTASSLSQNTNYLGTITGSENNIMSVDVGACGGTLNIPCASVTICVPGSTTNCQTINNLLVDTGSYGLRIFSSLVTNITLPAVTDTLSGDAIGECVGYLDGSGDWGSVNYADVYLGGTSGQKASNIPIQLINSAYSGYNPSSDCAGYQVNLDTSPTSTGFNGVLGVGQFTHDCSGCDTSSNNYQYYKCTGSTCTTFKVNLADEVQNPVSNFGSGFNNGIVLELPGVPSTGAVSAPGYAIFGISSFSSDGASAANTPGSGVTVYTGDTNGNIQTTFDGTDYYTSFLDSGSNGLYFPQPSSLPSCSSSLSSFFCPCSLTDLTATFNNAAGSLTGTNVSFSIGNASVDFDQSNPNMVYSSLGGGLSGEFDWGLPFFLGRTVFIGINGKAATINTKVYTGPFFAF